MQLRCERTTIFEHVESRAYLDFPVDFDLPCSVALLHFPFFFLLEFHYLLHLPPTRQIVKENANFSIFKHPFSPVYFVNFLQILCSAS